MKDWRCRFASCDGRWRHIGDALVNQCRRSRCRRILGVVIALPQPGLKPSALDALQNTSGLPAPDWPGCID